MKHHPFSAPKGRQLTAQVKALRKNIRNLAPRSVDHTGSLLFLGQSGELKGSFEFRGGGRMYSIGSSSFKYRI